MKLGIVLLLFCVWYFLGLILVEDGIYDGVIGWFAIGFGIWGLVSITRVGIRRLRRGRPTKQS